MTVLHGHYDGRVIVLDEPVPAGLPPDTPVEVTVLEAAPSALDEQRAFLAHLWSQPRSELDPKVVRSWTRDELYDER